MSPWDSADLAFAFLTTVGVVFVLCVTGYVVDKIEDWRASKAIDADGADHRQPPPAPEIDEQYYRHCLDAASVAGSPWPPAKVVSIQSRGRS